MEVDKIIHISDRQLRQHKNKIKDLRQEIVDLKKELWRYKNESYNS